MFMHPNTLSKKMNDQRMYILKRNNDYFGVRDNTMYSNHMSYTIGFGNIHHAKRVQYTYDQNKQIGMFRHKTLDIANDVNMIMNNEDLFDSLIIDVDVDIIIPKFKHSVTSELHIEEIRADEFLMIPFEKNVGIILPVKLDYETNDNIVFKCQLVEPIGDTKWFKN